MSLFLQPNINVTDQDLGSAKSSAISKQYVYPNRQQQAVETKMVKLLLIHYSLVKGIYGKPNKWVAQAAGGLSFLCLFSLSLFIYLLCLTQTEYWIYLNEYKKGIRSDWGIGIIGAVLIASSIIQDKYFRVNFKMKKDILIVNVQMKTVCLLSKFSWRIGKII